MDDAEASRFELRAKGEADVNLRRELEAYCERKGIIEAEARTQEEMKEKALEGKKLEEGGGGGAARGGDGGAGEGRRRGLTEGGQGGREEGLGGRVVRGPGARGGSRTSRGWRRNVWSPRHSRRPSYGRRLN